jgi:hypothetical protein
MMTRFSSGDMFEVEAKGMGGVATLLEVLSHGRDVLRPMMCHTSGLVLARPGWTNFPLKPLSPVSDDGVISL